MFFTPHPGWKVFLKFFSRSVFLIRKTQLAWACSNITCVGVSVSPLLIVLLYDYQYCLGGSRGLNSNAEGTKAT